MCLQDLYCFQLTIRCLLRFRLLTKILSSFSNGVIQLDNYICSRQQRHVALRRLVPGNRSETTISLLLMKWQRLASRIKVSKWWHCTGGLGTEKYVPLCHRISRCSALAVVQCRYMHFDWMSRRVEGRLAMMETILLSAFLISVHRRRLPHCTNRRDASDAALRLLWLYVHW